ncbi:S9 family peptidase, partial [Planococcus sp. SIMBA_143]
YLCPVDQSNQIFVQSLDGSPAVQMTDEGGGIAQFKWAPTGQGLYYIARANESEEIKKRKETYGDFHHVGREYRNHCLYYVDINNPGQKAQSL